MKKYLILFVIAILFSGCMTSSKQMIIEDNQQLALRSYQTKSYNYGKELVARSAVAALQDLGFILDKADMPTGTITATKLKQAAVMKITIVVREQNNQSVVRANAQFGSNMEMPSAVEDESVYQSFFSVLDKAVFFEAEGL